LIVILPIEIRALAFISFDRRTLQRRRQTDR